MISIITLIIKLGFFSNVQPLLDICLALIYKLLRHTPRGVWGNEAIEEEAYVPRTVKLSQGRYE